MPGLVKPFPQRLRTIPFPAHVQAAGPVPKSAVRRDRKLRKLWNLRLRSVPVSGFEEKTSVFPGSNAGAH